MIRGHELEIQRDLGVLPQEPWSCHRHARDKVLQAAPGYHGLRKTIVILSRALDLLRGATPEQTQAFLSQAYKAAQATAYHPNKQWTYGWPLLVLDDPDGAQRPGHTPSDHAALAVFHRDQGSESSGSGSAKGAGATDVPGGDSGAKSGPSWTR